MSGSRSDRGESISTFALTVAAAMLSGFVVVNPILMVAIYGWYPGWVIAGSVIVAPFALALGWSALQSWRDTAEQSFEPTLLFAASWGALGSGALILMPYLGLMLDLVLVPVVLALLVVSWVQPRPVMVMPAFLLGLGLVAMVVWCLVEAEEHAHVAVVPTIGILVLGGLLWYVRRHSPRRRPIRTATAAAPWPPPSVAVANVAPVGLTVVPAGYQLAACSCCGGPVRGAHVVGGRDRLRLCSPCVARCADLLDRAGAGR